VALSVGKTSRFSRPRVSAGFQCKFETSGGYAASRPVVFGLSSRHFPKLTKRKRPAIPRPARTEGKVIPPTEDFKPATAANGHLHGGFQTGNVAFQADAVFGLVPVAFPTEAPSFFSADGAVFQAPEFFRGGAAVPLETFFPQKKLICSIGLSV